MHGTGTPLGDPIETGAACAALKSDSRPLQLSAAKSILGHAEPAAGSVGMAHAAFILFHHQTSLFPHVRTPNPHVLSVLEAGGKSAVVEIPRQSGGAISQQVAPAMGVSAFAFQGTNAHAILQQLDIPKDEAAQQGPAWARQRFWFTVCSFATLYRAIAGQDLVNFQTSLTHSALAFFMDHQIQGTPLFPGAGMFDMASTACHTLRSSVRLQPFALLGASIAAPLRMQGGLATVLICSVQLSRGTVNVQSQSKANMAQMHLSASYGGF